eukprot:s478_g8.t1
MDAPRRFPSRSSVRSQNSGMLWPAGLGMALGFSVLAAATKATGTRLSSYERIFLRSCFCVLLAPIAGENSFPPLSSPNRRLLMLRGALGFIAVSSYYEAIARIPLATLTLISRLHPLLSTVLAGLILGEPVPRQQMVVLLVATLGTALLAPAEELFSSDASAWGYSAALLAALFTALALLCVRTLTVLGEPAHHAREAFHWGNLCGSLVLGLPRGFSWPTSSEALWILITAVSMQLAQLALTHVLRSPVVSATKYFFLNVVLNLAFGVLLGDPWPSARETLGAAVILLSIAYGGSIEAVPVATPAAATPKKSSRMQDEYGWPGPLFSPEPGANSASFDVDVVLKGSRWRIRDVRHTQEVHVAGGITMAIFRTEAQMVLQVSDCGGDESKSQSEAVWSQKVEVKLSRVGLSLILAEPMVELFYAQLEVIRLELRQGSEEAQQLRLSVAAAQVDCQLSNRVDARNGFGRSLPARAVLPAMIFANRGDGGRAFLSQEPQQLALANTFNTSSFWESALREESQEPLRCSEITSCNECFRSGCFGWFGSECCSKDMCLMAMQGDRQFFQSCDEWKRHEDSGGDDFPPRSLEILGWAVGLAGWSVVPLWVYGVDL